MVESETERISHKSIFPSVTSTKTIRLAYNLSFSHRNNFLLFDSDRPTRAFVVTKVLSTEFFYESKYHLIKLKVKPKLAVILIV